MLLTKPPKIEGASIGEKKTHKRKLSGGEDLLKGFLQVHESLAQASIGATPRRYIAFLNTYQQVYRNKKSGIEKRQYHLQVSLSIRFFHMPIYEFLTSFLATNLLMKRRSFVKSKCAKLKWPQHLKKGGKGI